MTRHYITNTKTFGQTARSTLGSLTGWVLTIAIGYGAWHFGNRWLDDQPYRARERRVREAIDTRDYVKASALLEEFDQRNLLKPEQEADLRSTLDGWLKIQHRDEAWQKFDAMLAAEDVRGAETHLKELAASGEYPAADIQNARTKMAEYTEPGLFQAIQQRPGNRQQLIERYLQIHRDGPNRPTVLQHAFIDSVGTLTDLLVERADFEKTYAQVVSINALCERYAQEPVPRTSVITLTELTAKLQDYERNYAKLMPGAVPDTGSLVRVVPGSGSQYFQKTFVAERNQHFSPGTIGTVVDINLVDDPDTYIVRFDEHKNVRWSETWGFPEYATNGPKNFARYKADELRVIARLSETQRNQFHFETARMRDHLQRVLAASQSTAAPQAPIGMVPTP